MASINETVASYVAVWNERDDGKRRALIARTWAESGVYTDAHRHGTDHASIDTLIKTAQETFPAYKVRLVSGIEAHHGHVRFSWAAGGMPDAPLYLGGTDFATIGADGRFTSVVGFTDAAPAPAA